MNLSYTPLIGLVKRFLDFFEKKVLSANPGQSLSDPGFLALVPNLAKKV
jgi:hypothetical protein